MASLRDLLRKLGSGVQALTEKPKPLVQLSPQIARRAAQIPRARQSLIQSDKSFQEANKLLTQYKRQRRPLATAVAPAKFVKDVAQGTARNVGTATLTALQNPVARRALLGPLAPLEKKFQLKQGGINLKDPISKTIFGKNAQGNYRLSGFNEASNIGSQELQKFGLSEGTSKKVAPVLVAGSIFADLIPGGRGGKAVSKKVLSKIAKAYGDDVARVAAKYGNDVAQKILNAKSGDDVARIVKSTVNISKRTVNTKPVFSASKDLDTFRDQVIKGLESLDSGGLAKTGRVNLNRMAEAEELLKRIKKNPKDQDAVRKGAEIIKLTGTDSTQAGFIDFNAEITNPFKKGKPDDLLSQARKFDTPEEFVRKVINESNISQQGKFETIPLNKIKGTDYSELDSALKSGKLSLKDAQNLLPDNEINMANSKVSMPIEVIKNSDGTYSLMAGNHRVAQQLVNGEKSILANIQNEKGFSTKSQLIDIWKKARGSEAGFIDFGEIAKSIKNLGRRKGVDVPGSSKISNVGKTPALKNTPGVPPQGRQLGEIVEDGSSTLPRQGNKASQTDLQRLQVQLDARQIQAPGKPSGIGSLKDSIQVPTRRNIGNVDITSSSLKVKPDNLAPQGRFVNDLGIKNTGRGFTPDTPLRERLAAEGISDLEKARRIAKQRSKRTSNFSRLSRRLGSIEKAIQEYRPPKGTGDIFKRIEKGVREGVRKSSPITRNPEQLRDVGGFDSSITDPYRVFERVYGRGTERLKEVERIILRPFDEAKRARVEFVKNMGDDLQENVIQNLNIKPRSKESALVQAFGEKRITLDELKSQAPNKWQEIVEADKFFRNRYDSLLDKINSVRKKIYPNQPEKVIPKRDDYYRHFQDLTNEYERAVNTLSRTSDISPGLEGTSAFTRPKTRFQSIFQRRTGDETALDAVQGYINYLESSSHAIHIDPFQAAFQNMADGLTKNVEKLPQGQQLNGFIRFLRQYANNISGKTDVLDRVIIDRFPGGRKTFGLLNQLNNRFRANAVLGNIASALNQPLNIPNGIADAGIPASIKGLGRSARAIFNKGSYQESSFITERYAQSALERFDERLINKPKKATGWILEVMDEVSTKYIWNAEYSKALQEGIKDPVRFADIQTRKMVGGRGVGERSLFQSAQATQLVAPFTLEVTNQWLVMRDFVSAKNFGKLFGLLILNNLVNSGMEKVTGNRVLFDPIDALLEGVEDEEVSIPGRLVGEVLSNVPLGQTVAQVVPEGSREKFFGGGDPTRFGTGIPVLRAFEDPLTSLVTPFGGRQIEKTLQGLGAYSQGASTSASGRVRYPVKQTPLNALKTATIGQYGSPYARFYFDNALTPFGDKDTALFNRYVQAGYDPERVWKAMYKKRVERLYKEKVQDIINDETLRTVEQKRAEGLKAKQDAQRLIKELNKI